MRSVSRWSAIGWQNKNSACRLRPFVGAVLATLILRHLAFGASASTSDEYMRAFHERQPSIPLREVPGKLLAGISTIGLEAVGLEGPSIYAGSSLGLSVHSRLGAWLRRRRGPTAHDGGVPRLVWPRPQGTPATGVMFAMEAPTEKTSPLQALLPSLLAAASSYATFVALVGTEPVVPLLDNDAASVLSVQAVDLLGALLLGLGGGPRWSKLRLVGSAGQGNRKGAPGGRRLLIGGASMAALAVGSDAAFGESLTLGPGTDAMAWVVDDRTLQLIALLFLLRIAATAATLIAGGVGGLFIPLAALVW